MGKPYCISNIFLLLFPFVFLQDMALYYKKQID